MQFKTKYKINDLVIYDNKEYKIVWIYDSGYFEIKEKNESKFQSVKLVIESDIVISKNLQ